MKIRIEIERGSYAKGSADEKKANRSLKALIATEFPVGLLCTKDGDTSGHQSFEGTIEDFEKAVKIKKDFLDSDQTADDTHKMNAKLMPIYHKHKDKLNGDNE